jgi:hypothetical protein
MVRYGTRGRLAVAAGLALAGALLPAAVAAAAVPAHAAGPDADSYRSQLTSITPPVRGLVVVVAGNGESITLTNDTGGVVEVPGYAGEPYLRFDRHQVEENGNSVSARLNGNSVIDALPTAAAGAAQAAPAWKVVATGNTFSWHDHRVHWMSQVRPPQVAADPGKAQKVLTWQVPMTAAGNQVVVQGDLLWLGDSGSSPVLTVVALVVTGLVVAGLLLVRRRNRAATAPDFEPARSG